MWESGRVTGVKQLLRAPWTVWLPLAQTVKNLLAAQKPCI